ncbi:E3 ubiquitin protein ligase RIE1-like [Bidens hawaiensis]|uniref:E3 ubiquitin protein ligase RIE1-like n=1 Tax=Bidens hawaiensis TaxID=980011 RepID=UPI00404ACC54
MTTEITTPVPEITEITAVDEPLLSQPHLTVPPSAELATASTRVPMLLGLFAGRRGASLIVSQNVALQMEDYREEFGYSVPVVAVETVWNLAFVVVAVVMVFWIAREERSVRLRVWICGYAVHCVANVVVLLVEYRKRRMRESVDVNSEVTGLTSGGSSSEIQNDGDCVLPIRWDLLNEVLYHLWSVVGFVWIVSYNNSATPHLFWLSLAFLAMDVFFLILRSLFYFLLAAAYCFCLPCILAFMYYMKRQERASEADISRLPVYEIFNVEEPGVSECRMIPKGTNGPDYSTELVIHTEYAECCICLSHYEDGEPLHLLLCGHHFHSTCIVKWLRLKATCPVCKSRVALNEQV